MAGKSKGLMMVTSEHGKRVADCWFEQKAKLKQEANTAFIVKAVNNFHHLERIIELWDKGGNLAGAVHNARLDLGI